MEAQPLLPDLQDSPVHHNTFTRRRPINHSLKKDYGRQVAHTLALEIGAALASTDIKSARSFPFRLSAPVTEKSFPLFVSTVNSTSPKGSALNDPLMDALPDSGTSFSFGNFIQPALNEPMNTSSLKPVGGL
ncbi:hypothetical protein CCACVL1_28303 [Corchorus capsularis]|uniref:Uncharacterized protein n=1 Tax=Corchorus capsularis TaxID=210143 RepID=A0A1R3G6X2_COCAP|nr:hypothetical protein CCACVL1_28303 [Corchorus capsularis]